MNEKKLRHLLVKYSRKINKLGLNQGTAGNISVLQGADMLITPSGIPCKKLKPGHMAKISLVYQVADDSESPDINQIPKYKGKRKPSSEWRFHRDLLKSNDQFGAIIHTHSTFSTILSLSRRSIPSCHYMIAQFGGNTVRCADYATFGTAQLSDNILAAMENRSACLIANHGMVVAGRHLRDALHKALELEELAKQYYHALLTGNLHLLPDSEMAIVMKQFENYGQQQPVKHAKSRNKNKK